MAAFIQLLQSTLGFVMPFLGFAWGAVVGFAGVVAFALGRWLSHRP